MFTLEVEIRTTFGRIWSRRQRRGGKIPAVIYGGTTPPLHILLDRHTFAKVLEERHPEDLILIVEQTRVRAGVQKIQRPPLGEEIEHVDFIRRSTREPSEGSQDLTPTAER